MDTTKEDFLFEWGSKHYVLCNLKLGFFHPQSHNSHNYQEQSNRPTQSTKDLESIAKQFEQGPKFSPNPDEDEEDEIDYDIPLAPKSNTNNNSNIHHSENPSITLEVEKNAKAPVVPESRAEVESPSQNLDPNTIQAEIATWRGLTVKQDTKKSENVIEVPLELIGTKYHLPEIFQQDPCFNEHEHEDTFLSLWLIIEKYKGKDSKWFHYINTLPPEYSSSALWSSEEISLLKGSPAYDESLGLREWPAKNFKTLKNALSQGASALPPNFPTEDKELLKDLTWAVHTIWSRAFSDIGEKKTTGLVPLADLINHSSKPNAVFEWNATKNRFEISCTESVKAGQELLVSYGDKNNADLLTHYGFIEQENEYNSIKMKLPSNMSSLPQQQGNLWKEKQLFLGKYNIRKTSWWVEHEVFPADFIVALRVYFMTEKEFSKFRETCTDEEVDLEPFSDHNEQFVQDALQQQITGLLNAYLWTWEKDKLLLSETKLTPRLEMIVRLVESEKAILHHLYHSASRLVRDARLNSILIN